MSIHLRIHGRSVAGLVVVLSLAACSSSTPTAQGGASGSLSAPSSAPAGGSSAPAGGSSAPAGGSSAPVTGGAGGADAPYCAAMKVADAQALVKVTIAAAQTGGPESCAFVLPGQGIDGDNLTVTVFPGDSNNQYYNDAVSGPASSTPNPLPGVGDVAVWEQVVAGASAPEVAAHKGSLTCVVQAPADTSQLTIDQTGSGPIYQISSAAAAAYAAKEAVLCTDLFSVGS
jgi:hypothetical protein